MALVDTTQSIATYALALIAVVIFSVALPQTLYAAELQFAPKEGSFSSGSEFSVKVVIDPQDATINAVDGIVKFDSSVLSVSNVTKDGSVLSLWTADPSFSNSEGTVTFSGGSPKPISAPGTVLTIIFKPKKVGAATVSFTKGSVLAADGKGTDVYKGGQEGAYTIGEGKKPAPEPEPTSSGDEGDVGIKDPAPDITSPTHDKSDNWYATTTAIFLWKMDSDVIQGRFSFGDKADAKATELLKKDESSKMFTEVKDGVWYFALELRSGFGWSETARKQIQIDTVPPEDFDIAVVEGGEKPMFKFETTDALSGVDRYELRIGETVAVTIKLKDLVNGQYPIPAQEGGSAFVTIKAYDKANNVREVQRDLTLPKVEKAKGKGEEEAVAAPTSPWTAERILVILFAFSLGAVVTWALNVKKTNDKDRILILQEVLAMREKNSRLFQAMREEFEQMVSDFDEKPQLTDDERLFLEKMKEVVDISEELLDASIEELKKAVRGKS
jgi:hypothetical protein